MKRNLLKITSMFMLMALCIPTIFATNLEPASRIVKVGTVDSTDVVYDVDIKWGSLVYNFVKTQNEYGEYYEWEPEEKWISDNIRITNYSNVSVSTELIFTSAIDGVNGFMDYDNSTRGSTQYNKILVEPEDFTTDTTGKYFELDEDGHFVNIKKGTTFEADKYYCVLGGGGGPVTNGIIPGMESYLDGGEIHVNSISYVLALAGGSISNVRPGATIGTVIITIS